MALAGMGVLDHDSVDEAPTSSLHWQIMGKMSAEAIMSAGGEPVVHPKKRVMGMFFEILLKFGGEAEICR